MNSQQLLNLEYLQRATDPRIPEAERLQMVESLGYALSADANAPDWVIATFDNIRTEALSDPMLLWLADWAESLPRERIAKRVCDLMADLWRPGGNPTIQARLFECAVTLERAMSDLPAQQMSSATDRIFEAAVEHEGAERGMDSVLALLDMALARNDRPLVTSLATKLNGRHLKNRELLLGHIARRLPRLSGGFRDFVVDEFKMEQ
jgi:hypothetical protein